MSNAFAESSWGLPAEPSQWLLPAWANPLVDGASGLAERPRMLLERTCNLSNWRNVQALLDRRYSQRGLRLVPQESPEPGLATLQAQEDGEVVGTLSVRIDGANGALLAADATFPQEMAMIRQQGRKLCEFTRLAVESEAPSKSVLARLFHLAHLYAHRIKGAELVVLELHPRHAPFYRRGLNAMVVGPERTHESVNAPAVLLCIDLVTTQLDINHMGGRADLADKTRTLYPHAFSPADEPKWIGRLSASFD
jgi:hypothetical protein